MGALVGLMLGVGLPYCSGRCRSASERDPMRRSRTGTWARQGARDPAERSRRRATADPVPALSFFGS